ncbi:DUF3224 domain-containing protein [Actinopolymorpha pittospori]
MSTNATNPMNSNDDAGSSDQASAAGGIFTTLSWEEPQPGEDDKGPRVAHVHTTTRFEGVIAGTSDAHYVLFYGGGTEGWGDGHYHGYEQVTGTVDGRSGTFVLAHDGGFSGTTVKATWTVVPGSATDGLTGLRGHGGFTAGQSEGGTPYTFVHEFDGE